jgi:tetratricopeptide (TPR) repeat protein
MKSRCTCREWTRLTFIALLCLFLIPDRLTATCNPDEPRGPVSDSILKQQRDSMLMELNLRYLNGVNDHYTPYQLISIIEDLLELDPGQYNYWFNMGLEYIKIHKYYLAIDALNKAIELYPNREQSALIQAYISLSFCYNKIEKHQKEKEILDLAAAINPEHPGIIGRYVICAYSRMLFPEAEDHLHHLTLVLRKEGFNEAEIAYYIGRLYLNTDILVAEQYFRVACRYDPGDVEKRGALAWVLIQNALRLNEGMSLMEETLKEDPKNPVYIHQQGYGFYRKGDYDKALANLYNAKKLYQEYSYELDEHIRMVEEAIVSEQ